MIHLRFRNRLSVRSVEAVLYVVSPTTKKAQGWTESARAKGLFVDLSSIEFAEFSALGRVAVAIEGALRHGIAVRLALPLTTQSRFDALLIKQYQSSLDEKLLHLAQTALVRRQRVKQFLEVSGFLAAIKFDHVPGVAELFAIDPAYDRPLDDVVDSSFELEEEEQDVAESDLPVPSYLLSKIFPFRWFDRLAADELRRSTFFMETIIEFRHLGLSPFDAQTITNIVLQELVENVSHHASEQDRVSCSPKALVGAIALGEHYRITASSLYPCLKECIDSIPSRINRDQPVIVLFVGDSGLGIPNTLGPFFQDKHNREIPKLLLELSVSQKILFWAFTPWSTSLNNLHRSERGTRGLWRVRRVLRTYGGFVSIRSGDSLVGWNHTDEGTGVPFAESKRLRYVVGTMIDCWLLPGLDRTLDETTTGQADLRRHTTPLPDYSVVFLDSVSADGIPEATIERLIDEAAQSSPAGVRCVIAILSGHDVPSYRPEVLESILRSISSIALNGSVVLICPGLAAREVAIVGASLDAYYHEQLHQRRFPVLFLDTFGEGQWLGATPEIRNVLDQLFEGKTVNLLELKNQFASPHELWNDLLNMPELIRLDESGSLQCLLEPSQIFTAIGTAVAQQIKRAISKSDGKAVYTGCFLTPSLRYVAKWIQLPMLLPKLGLESMIGYLISGLIQRVLFPRGGSDLRLCRIDGERLEFYGEVLIRLNIPAPQLVVTGNLDSSDREAFRLASEANKTVVIITGLIFSENTLRQAVTDLLSSGVREIAVCCVIDARLKKTEFLECSGKYIRVVSITQIDIHSVATSTAIPIDPVLNVPVFNDLTYEDERVNKRSIVLTDWLRDHPQSLMFRHVIRKVGSHCTLYPNARQLLGPTSTYKVEVITHMTAVIKERLKAAPIFGANTPERVSLLLPARENYSEILANGILEELSSDGIYARQIVVPRESYLGGWIFPRYTDMDLTNHHAVIVEWGAVTATTIQEMVRLASDAGARSIVVLTLMSQLSEEEQSLLVKYQSLLATHYSRNVGDADQPLFQATTSFQEAVPVMFHFVTRVRFGSYAPPDCPVCKTVIELRSASKTAPGQMLRDHTERVAADLNPSEFHEASSKINLDVFGVPIETKEIAEILALRMLLEECVRSTIARRVFLEKLCGIRDNQDIRGGSVVIRLLAAEPSWFDSPVLRIDLVRRSVAEIARLIAKADYDLPTEPGVKCQAISILRRSSDALFLALLPELVEFYLSERSIVQHLLGEVHLYLESLRTRWSDSLYEIHEPLTRCRVCVRAALATGKANVDYLFTIDGLMRQAEFLLNHTRQSDTSRHGAWLQLRLQYLVPIEEHVSVVSSFNKVLSSLSLPSTVLRSFADLELLQLAEHWNRCAWFLAAAVFPYLPRLRDILTSSCYSNVFSIEERAALDRLTTLAAPSALNPVSEMLHNFASNPTTFQDEALRSRCYHELLSWGTLALNKLTNAEDSRGAKLLRIVKSCPASIATVIRSVAADMGRRSATLEALSRRRDIPDDSVFCDSTILEATLRHIFENALARERIVDVLEPIDFHIRLERKEGNILLTVFNSNTRSKMIGGRGLSTVAEAMRPFGASLTYEESIEGPWTFSVTLILEHWTQKKMGG